jgi:Amt family ammonium transporter
MSRGELGLAANTIWVVLTAVLVMLMQGGFALLEAGVTRAKNAAHVTLKNLLSFAVCSVVYWAVGFGLAFGDGGRLIGGHGFFPGMRELLDVGAAPFTAIASVPGAAGYLFEVVFAGVSLAIVWGAMAERTKLWVYFAFGVAYTLLYSIVSHWVWHPSGWLYALGMQDYAGSTVVHFQGALAALAGTLLLGPRIGRFGRDGRARAIGGHNLPLSVIGTLVLWFCWFGFNPGSTMGVETGGRIGFFAYVAVITNVAAAAGAMSAALFAWLVLRKADVPNTLNGALGALVAVTAASGFVEPWSAVLIGLVSGVICVLVPLGFERIRIDDPVGALAVHGAAGIWGTLACGLFASPALVKMTGRGTAGLIYSGSFHQLGVQIVGLLAVGAVTFSASYAILWVFRRTWGIRVSAEAELSGLDLHEHGSSGYDLGVLAGLDERPAPGLAPVPATAASTARR